MATQTLTGFLLARLDEAEAEAQQAELDLERLGRERAANGGTTALGRVTARDRTPAHAGRTHHLSSRPRPS